MNNFEHKIKNRLDNYNSEIDPYEIWDGIQAKRNKKKKRRWGFIWLAASVLLIVSTVFIISSRYGSNNDTIVKLNKSNTVKISSKNIQKRHDIPVINSKNSNDDELSAFTKSQKTNHIQNQSANIEYNSTESSDHYDVKANNKLKKSKTREINTSIAFTDVISIEKSTVKKSSQIENSTNNSEIITNKSKELLNIQGLNIELKELSFTSYLLAINFDPVPGKSCKHERFNSKPYPELAIAGNYTHNDYSLKNPVSESFMSNVKNNEKQLESFDFFFGYHIPIYRGVGLFAGFNYGQVDSKLDFTFEDKKEIIIDSTLTKIVYKSLTDTLKIYERAKTNATYEIHDVKYNYRRYLRIPLLLTYASSIKSLKYEMRVGADFNIMTCNNAKTISQEGKTVSIEATELNLNRNKILGDFHFDFRLEFKINKNLAVLFGPQYKMSLGSLMQEKAGFDQYRHSIGVNIGAKYRYN